MQGNMLNTTPDELKALLTDARAFSLRYETALRSFKQNDALWRMISDKALDYLEDQFNLHRQQLDRAAQTFFTEWKLSQQYRQLEVDLEILVQGVRLTLARTYSNPPSLSEIHKAVRLTTKATRLVGILAASVDDAASWLASGKQLPIRRVHKPAVGRAPKAAKKTTAPWAVLPSTWWEWFGILAGGIALAFYLHSFLGLSQPVAVGVSVVLAIGLFLSDVAIRALRR